MFAKQTLFLAMLFLSTIFFIVWICLGMPMIVGIGLLIGIFVTVRSLPNEYELAR